MAEQRVSRWYFGGLASSGAACCTHPLDLLKVTGGHGGGGPGGRAENDRGASGGCEGMGTRLGRLAVMRG